MYVDKALTGLAAVQTLSRLNRTYDRDGIRKEGTFVLDFRNDAEDIRASFEPWYGETVAPPTDPNLLYDTRRDLDVYGVLLPEEIERTVPLLLAKPKPATDRVHAAAAPAVDRVGALDDDEKERFLDALKRILRTYAFLSQVVAFTDTALERDYLYCKALSLMLRTDSSEKVDPDVELTYLRLEQSFEGSFALTGSDGEVTTIFGGAGKIDEPPPEPLSRIIERLNERFGTTFDPEDRLLLDSVAEKLIRRPDIQRAAAANSADNFGLLLGKEFQSGVLDQLGVAEDMVLTYLDNPAMQAEVLDSTSRSSRVGAPCSTRSTATSSSCSARSGVQLPRVQSQSAHPRGHR